MPLTQFPLMLTPYITMALLSNLNNRLILDFISVRTQVLSLFQDPVQDTMLHFASYIFYVYRRVFFFFKEINAFLMVQVNSLLQFLSRPK